MPKGRVEVVNKITEREIFAVAVCVDSIWNGDANLLDAAKSRFLQSGWSRSFSIMLLANKSILSFLEKSGFVQNTPRSILNLSMEINSWIPPVFQIPGDAIVENIQIIVDPSAPFAQQKLASNPLAVALNWLIIFSGLISCAATLSNHDPYTVMLKTLISIENIP